jgi:hypothetical protein
MSSLPWVDVVASSALISAMATNPFYDFCPLAIRS